MQAEEDAKMTVALQATAKPELQEITAVWPGCEMNALNSDGFQRWVEMELELDVAKLTIDLRNITYVNAAGLAAMVRAARVASDYGIDVCWRNLNPIVAKLLDITGLNRILDVG
jgi:anti-anti-sigma factor